MKAFSIALRRQDRIAVAAVTTIAAVIFLLAGMLWQCAVFALLAGLNWYRIASAPRAIVADDNSADHSAVSAKPK